MPYADATWDDAFFDEMRRTHDQYGQKMFWWGLSRWKQAHQGEGRDLDLAVKYLDEYWLPHYKLDRPQLIITRAAELIMPGTPEPGPNPVELSPEVIERGQKLFWDHGLEILLLLACYSLPAAYAAFRGVKVLAATRFLSHDPNLRLMETTQLVINVLAPHGLDDIQPVGPEDRTLANPVPELRPPMESLDPEQPGSGIRLARMVRLLHAGIRPYVQLRDKSYDVDVDGKAINQEDLAATLMTFSWVVLDGLRKLNVEVDAETSDAFVRIWAHVGHEVGVDHRLLPLDFAEAAELTQTIRKRQVIPEETRKNPEGPEMLRALLDWMRGQLPLPLRWVPATMVRVCLEPEYRDVADSLQVPRHAVLLLLTRFVLWLQARLGLPLFRIANRVVVRRMQAYERAGRPAYKIPRDLAEKWGVHRA